MYAYVDLFTADTHACSTGCIPMPDAVFSHPPCHI